MTCEEFQDSLSALIDSELDTEEVWALDEHLSSCEACRAERDALQQVADQVGGLTRQKPPPHFLAQVMASVVAEPVPLELEASAPPRLEASAPPPAKGRLVPGAAATPPAAAPTPPLAGQATPASSEPPLSDFKLVDDELGDCTSFNSEISAYLDGVLELAERTRLQEHLIDCDACRAEHTELARVHKQVRALPRIQVPPPFLSRVMNAIEEDERRTEQRAEQARETRALWFKRAGVFAQAAGFLLVVAVGVGVSAPSEDDWNVRGYMEAKQRPAVNPPPPPPPGEGTGQTLSEIAPGPYDARWELAVPGDLNAAIDRTKGLINSYARTSKGNPSTRGYVVQVPANNVDDLHQGLDQAPEVETNQGSWDSLKSIHSEQDKVVLKNGFVLVGHVIRQDRQGATIRVGESVYFVEPQETERIERAGTLRRIRIDLRKQD